MAPKWNFLPTPKGGVHGDSSTDNFFMHDGGTVVDNLVRENIQNALDARIAGKVVKVRFALHRCPSGLKDLMQSVLNDDDCSVLGHYKKAVEEKDGVPNFVDLDNASFLLIEDFNTHGLRGDIKVNDKGGFAMFWRNTGISDKNLGGNRGGSFGIGKVVNPMASEINTFFGLTVRSSDEEKSGRGPYLMGQVMLRTHRYKGKRYQPYALFGECRSEMEAPVSDERFIAKFKEASGISRKERESGFSLAIPFPKAEFSRESVLSAVLVHYFFPIVEGRLVVELAIGGRPLIIDSESIKSLAADLSAELSQKIDFAALIVAQKKSGRGKRVAKLTTIDSYNDGLRETHFSKADIDEMRADYDDGKLLVVEVPVETVKKRDEVIEESSVTLFIKRSECPGTFYIRAGISVYDNPKVPGHIKCMALLLAEDGEISELLRKSEGPAHTKWVQRNSQAVPVYKNATLAVGFVNGLLSDMAKLLENDVLDEDVDILADDFPDDESSGDEEDDDGDDEGIDSGPVYVAITRRVDGEVVFTQGPAMMDPENSGKAFEVSIQYLSAMRGAKWRPYDFDLAQKNVEVDGAILMEASQNKLKLKLTAKFKVIVHGLDKRKDVKVSVDPIS